MLSYLKLRHKKTITYPNIIKEQLMDFWIVPDISSRLDLPQQLLAHYARATEFYEKILYFQRKLLKSITKNISNIQMNKQNQEKY